MYKAVLALPASTAFALGKQTDTVTALWASGGKLPR
jgi:hypothetical protein